MSLDASKFLAQLLTDAGIRATADVTKVAPPCVLITPPRRDYDLPCGYTATYTLVALAPSPGTLDAVKRLDDLADSVAEVLDVASVEPIAYEVPGQQSYPAYLITLDPIGVTPND